MQTLLKMPWPVLLMARELDLGGSERQLALLARALDRSKFEPIVGCFRPAGLRGHELETAGVPIAHFPVYSFASPGAVAGAWKLARFIRRRGIRLVHTFDYPLAAFALPVARLFTDAIAVSSQRSHRDLIPPGHRRLVRATDPLAAAVVVNCEFVRRHLEQDEGVPASRIRLCHNGIDLEEFSRRDFPRPTALPQNALVIGVVCALRPEKGLPDLLHAFARIRRAAAALKLAVVGSGSMLEELESLARGLGIADDCVFAPATEQVAAWLGAMDVFVLPSRSEALSNSLMEAMACGCCAVASNVGGNPELIRHGETGLLFEAGDVSGLAAVLELLIGNRSLRHRLAGAGTRWIRENFSLRASAERMGEIYAELIDARVRAAVE
jgi:L-malate glycosyltransferase